MEISLLTGVNIIITIFDKEEGNIIQYLSDSIEKFQVISQLNEVDVRCRTQVKSDTPDEAHSQKQKIVSEIYTNEHYNYLFNDGQLVNDSSSEAEAFDPSKEPPKKSNIDRKREKSSKYYRLKPPPDSMIQVSGGETITEGQYNLCKQLHFSTMVSHPVV
jgi:hypothetical protein